MIEEDILSIKGVKWVLHLIIFVVEWFLSPKETGAIDT